MGRKNGWQLAEAAGDRTPDGMQGFHGGGWDADAVRDDLRAYVVEHLGDPGAVLVLDETGFLKKGDKSAGVQRQYSGTAGRVENCQIGVFLGYASRHGRALIDRALYLPEGWAGDEARRARAGVPAGVTFATKPQLGARDAGAGAGRGRAVRLGDGGQRLRRRPRPAAADRGARRARHVLAVTSGQRLGATGAWTTGPPGCPSEEWQRLSAGEGAKGPRLYDWAFLPYRGGAPTGWGKGCWSGASSTSRTS